MVNRLRIFLVLFLLLTGLGFGQRLETIGEIEDQLENHLTITKGGAFVILAIHEKNGDQNSKVGMNAGNVRELLGKLEGAWATRQHPDNNYYSKVEAVGGGSAAVSFNKGRLVMAIKDESATLTIIFLDKTTYPATLECLIRAINGKYKRRA